MTLSDGLFLRCFFFFWALYRCRDFQEVEYSGTYRRKHACNGDEPLPGTDILRQRIFMGKFQRPLQRVCGGAGIVAPGTQIWGQRGAIFERCMDRPPDIAGVRFGHQTALLQKRVVSCCIPKRNPHVGASAAGIEQVYREGRVLTKDVGGTRGEQ